MSGNTFRIILVLLITSLLVSCVPEKEINSKVSELKIIIDGESFYAIPDSLLKKYGFIVDDYNNLTLFNNEIPVPIWIDSVTAKEKRIIFYGEETSSPYFNGNVYILKNNVGGVAFHPEIITGDDFRREAGDHQGNETGRSVLHIEKNLLYVPEAQAISHWYWKTVTPNNSIDIIFDLPFIQPGQIDMSLHLWSGTTNPNSLGHSVSISLNGHPIEEISWEGIELYKANFTLSSDWFQEDDNHLIIECPKFADSISDLIFLDAFDMHYSRVLSALESQIEFIATDESHSITGLDAKVLSFDVTDLSAPTFLGFYESSTDSLTIKTVPGHHYTLLETRDMAIPEISRLAESTASFQDMEGGDYLIIAPEKFKNSISRLVEYRQSQGHKVIPVSWQSIYDNFNNGIPDPMTINAFIKWANQEWKIKPEYLLLVGDSSYDLKGFISKRSENWLPPIFYYSLFGGETGTDIPLTDVNGDGLPDVALGRIPFSDPNEIDEYISKLIAYENSINDREERNIQIGIVAETESEFGDTATSFSDIIRTSNPENENLTTSIGIGLDSSRAVIFENSNDWLIYFGHGAIQVWGKENLLRIDDLESETLADFAPLVVNFTCLTGYFIHPEYDSITEALLKNENGPTAIVAPTSLTLSDSQGQLSKALAGEIASGKYLTIGELWVEVQGKQLITNAKDKDVLFTYLLFGDPATRLP